MRITSLKLQVNSDEPWTNAKTHNTIIHINNVFKYADNLHNTF